MSSGGREKVIPAVIPVEDAGAIIHQRRDTVRQVNQQNKNKLTVKIERCCYFCVSLY
jgi:hypothetical protein